MLSRPSSRISRKYFTRGFPRARSRATPNESRDRVVQQLHRQSIHFCVVDDTNAGTANTTKCSTIGKVDFVQGHFMNIAAQTLPNCDTCIVPAAVKILYVDALKPVINGVTTVTRLTLTAQDSEQVRMD